MNDLNGTWSNNGSVKGNTRNIREKSYYLFRLSKRMKRKRDAKENEQRSHSYELIFNVYDTTFFVSLFDELSMRDSFQI